MERLHLCTDLDIGEEARAKELDLFRILSVYTLHHWFDGYRARLVLDLEKPIVAIVDVDGRAEIYASSCNGINIYAAKLRWILGFEENLSEFHSIAMHDPLLSRFATEWRGWRLRGCDLWWALVVGVCQQNASFKQGWSMLLNIVNLYGRAVELDGFGRVVLPPRPEDIAKDPSKLVEARVGYRAQTIAGIARAFVEKSIPSVEELKKMNSSEIETLLRRLKGVGNYTARLAMALALRRYDLPPIDRWLKTIVSRVYGVEERYAENKWVEIWGRWSGLASIALTIALDAAPLREALARIERGELLPKMSDEPSPATLWKFASITKKKK